MIRISDVFVGLDILYFQKTADGRSIINGLTSSKVPFRVTRAELPEHFQTNGIACSTDAPIDAVKRIAHILMNSGVALRDIVQFRNPEKEKSNELRSCPCPPMQREKPSSRLPPLTRPKLTD